jgi:AraC family transcriptional regulator
MPKLMGFAPGLRFFTAEEDIRGGVEWALCRPVDTAILHLSGSIDQIETELDGCGAIGEPPMPGEFWLVPSGCTYLSHASGGRVGYAELHFDASFLSEQLGRRCDIAPRAGQPDWFLYQSFLRLQKLSQNSDDVSHLLAASLSQAMMVHFYRAHCCSSPARRLPSHLVLSRAEIRFLTCYLQDRLASVLRLEALASLVQRTPHEFLIAFRAAFGDTPAQHIINLRLRRARWLLLHSSKDIAAIAFDTGFSSHAHLTASFQARLGLSPRAYRKRLAVPGA